MKVRANSPDKKGAGIMNIRFINPKLHAVLDYAVAAALIAVPLIAGFSAESAAATWISVAAGVGLLGYSLVTGYSAGARKLISFRAHLVLDAAAAVALLVVPLAVGFHGVPRLFYWAVGAAVIVVVFATRVAESEGAAAYSAT